jgi:hypothetical protein
MCLIPVCLIHQSGRSDELESNGFLVEVRRRQASHRDEHRWDVLSMGVLRDGWLRSQG